MHRDRRFDLVIVDTPPTRSALDFLESPEKLARFLQHPIVKVLIAQGRGGLRIAGAAIQPVVKAIGRVIGNDALAGAIDDERFRQVQVLLRGQEHEARIWRDACTQYFATYSKRPLPAGIEPPEHALDVYRALAAPFSLVKK